MLRRDFLKTSILPAIPFLLQEPFKETEKQIEKSRKEIRGLHVENPKNLEEKKSKFGNQIQKVKGKFLIEKSKLGPIEKLLAYHKERKIESKVQSFEADVNLIEQALSECILVRDELINRHKSIFNSSPLQDIGLEQLSFSNQSIKIDSKSELVSKKLQPVVISLNDFNKTLSVLWLSPEEYRLNQQKSTEEKFVSTISKIEQGENNDTGFWDTMLPKVSVQNKNVQLKDWGTSLEEFNTLLNLQKYIFKLDMKDSSNLKTAVNKFSDFQPEIENIN